MDLQGRANQLRPIGNRGAREDSLRGTEGVLRPSAQRMRPSLPPQPRSWLPFYTTELPQTRHVRKAAQRQPFHATRWDRFIAAVVRLPAPGPAPRPAWTDALPPAPLAEATPTRQLQGLEQMGIRSEAPQSGLPARRDATTKGAQRRLCVRRRGRSRAESGKKSTGIVIKINLSRSRAGPHQPACACSPTRSRHGFRAAARVKGRR